MENMINLRNFIYQFRNEFNGCIKELKNDIEIVIIIIKDVINEIFILKNYVIVEINKIILDYGE